MKTNYSLGSIAAILAFAAFAQSCDGLVEVDEVNSINTESTVLKGTEVTLLSKPETRTLGELISSGSGGVLGVNAQGDYVISIDLVENQEIGAGFSFDANSFALNVNGNENTNISISENSVIPADTPISYLQSDKDIVAKYLKEVKNSTVDIDFFESLLSPAVDFEFDIDFSIDNFPELIKSFQKADLEGNISFKLEPTGTIPFSKFAFCQGFEIAFPSFLKFSSCDNKDFDLKDGNKLVANKDVALELGKDLRFNLALASLDLGDGAQTSGRLALEDKVTVKGTASLDTSDFTGDTENLDLTADATIAAILGLPFQESGHVVTTVKNDTPVGSLSIAADYATNNVKIKSATVKISEDALPAFDTDDYKFELGDLKDVEFLNGADVNIGLTDIQVNIAVESTLPFDFGLAANLSAVSDKGTKNYQFSGLDFAANAKTVYSLGTKADGVSGNVIYKNIPGIGNILNPLPSRVEVNDFKVTLPKADDWVTAEAGKNYGGLFSASLEAPVAFTADTKVTLDLNIDDVDVDLEQVSGYLKGDTKAILKVVAENEIPLNFDLALAIKDADGKEIEGVEVKNNLTGDKNITIAAGATGNPTTSNLEIKIVLPANSSMIKKLGFDASAYCDNIHEGARLNPNQKITLKDAKLSFPDGITTDIKDLVK